MICAVTVRVIKPGTFEAFREAVKPDPWLPGLDRVLVYRNEDSDCQVLTIGCFDATPEEFEALRDDPATLSEEAKRLERVAQYEERVLLNGIFHLSDELLPPG